MGLDAIELVMEVEETFGFSIPDEDAASLDTAGRLFDYIMSHRFQGRQQGCLSSVAFCPAVHCLVAGSHASPAPAAQPIALLNSRRNSGCWKSPAEASDR